MMRHCPADPRAVRRDPDTAPVGAPSPRIGEGKEIEEQANPAPEKELGIAAFSSQAQPIPVRPRAPTRGRTGRERGSGWTTKVSARSRIKSRRKSGPPASASELDCHHAF